MHKQLRLSRREDFAKVYKYGKSAANHQFAVYYMTRAETEQFRLGLSASKKIGNAVVRNRMRRVIKEIVRLRRESIVPHTDFIIIVRKPAVELSYEQLDKSVVHVLKRAGLLVKPAAVGQAKPDGKR